MTENEEKKLDIVKNNLVITELHDTVKNSKKYADFLFEKGIISKEIKNEIYENIRLFQVSNFGFVTKPFRYCDSMGQQLYHLMRSLGNRLRDVSKEAVNENQSSK